MSENVPAHGSATARDRIVLTLWGKGYPRQGQRIDPSDPVRCPYPTFLNLEIADAELLQREWASMPLIFEQVAAESIRTALLDWSREITEEDMCNEED